MRDLTQWHFFNKADVHFSVYGVINQIIDLIIVATSHDDSIDFKFVEATGARYINTIQRLL